jgi:hypothetical protein
VHPKPDIVGEVIRLTGLEMRALSPQPWHSALTFGPRVFPAVTQLFLNLRLLRITQHRPQQVDTDPPKDDGRLAGRRG